MHILHLSKRNGLAQERLLAAAKALAKAAEIDPALVDALSPKVKDPAVRAMMEREAAADLLEEIAIRAGVMDPRDLLPVTEEPAADVTTVTAESLEEPKAKDEETFVPADEAGLPSPILEPAAEEARAEGGLVEGSQAYLIGNAATGDIFVPTSSAIEEEPAEKAAPAKKTAGAKNRTSTKK